MTGGSAINGHVHRLECHMKFKRTNTYRSMGDPEKHLTLVFRLTRFEPLTIYNSSYFNQKKPQRFGVKGVLHFLNCLEEGGGGALLFLYLASNPLIFHKLYFDVVLCFGTIKSENFH